MAFGSQPLNSIQRSQRPIEIIRDADAISAKSGATFHVTKLNDCIVLLPDFIKEVGGYTIAIAITVIIRYML